MHSREEERKAFNSTEKRLEAYQSHYGDTLVFCKKCLEFYVSGYRHECKGGINKHE